MEIYRGEETIKISIIYTEQHIYIQKKTKKNIHHNNKLRHLYTGINTHRANMQST